MYFIEPIYNMFFTHVYSVHIYIHTQVYVCPLSLTSNTTPFSNLMLPLIKTIVLLSGHFLPVSNIRTLNVFRLHMYCFEVEVTINLKIQRLTIFNTFRQLLY